MIGVMIVGTGAMIAGTAGKSNSRPIGRHGSGGAADRAAVARARDRVREVDASGSRQHAVAGSPAAIAIVSNGRRQPCSDGPRYAQPRPRVPKLTCKDGSPGD